MTRGAEFFFRLWVYPEDSDPADIETWYQGLDPTTPDHGSLSIAEWARNHLQEEDLHELFDLDKDKYWQVVGKGTIYGSFDYFGEYDEEFNVIEFQKEEVPEAWFDGPPWTIKQNTTKDANHDS